jgi:type IX secretion system PorP/SprF family membrane protein
MKRFSIILVMLTATFIAKAQQMPITSFYDMYGHIYNPSTAGVEKYGQIGATFRKQWSGIPGGPQTVSLFGSTYFDKVRMGLGGYLYNDQTGPTHRTGLLLNYAYHIPTGNDGTFSLGIQGIFQQFGYDKEKLSNSLGAIDPVLASTDNRFRGDAGFGVSYTGKKLQIGASVSQLIQSQLKFYDGAGTPTEEGRLYRHYYGFANYKWNVDGETKIIPHALVVYLPNAPTEFQGGVRVEHQDLFWWGGSYRVNQSWMLSAGIRLKSRMNIGYTYDMYTTPVSGYERGSSAHEVMLRYDFKK